MAIKPILFNTEMVKAILDERKTVTRRLVKDAPENTYRVEPMNICADGTIYEWDFLYGVPFDSRGSADMYETIKSKYQTGDILYVRETWCKNNNYEEYYYKASGGPKKPPYNLKWHPSIHMPKEAARIFLQVKDVKVERLCEISGEDLLKEGIDKKILFDGPVSKAFNKFIEIWNSTIKPEDLDKYGWYANPWVWVIEFERCEKPVEE